MKFAHFSDVHLGSWREDSLREVSLNAFRKAIEICLHEEKVDCILIAGDLFDTSMPSVEILKETARILKKIKDRDVNVYVIPGSHDYSASGKTMIEVMEGAGLLVNVAKLEDNELRIFEDKSGLKIAGWHGKKGGLEWNEYSGINMTRVNSEPGFKVFMFHTLLEEFKPKDLDIIECMSVKNLPDSFSYYAGGHPHYIMQNDYGKGKITYPGALFPNNFKEIEVWKHGGFYIVEASEKPFGENEEPMSVRWIPVKIKEVVSFDVDAENKSAKQVETEILSKAGEVKDKIVTLRIAGQLSEGKISDIDFNRIENAFSNAFFVLKNTTKLVSREVSSVQIRHGNVEEIERDVIKEHIEKNESSTSHEEYSMFMNALDKEKEDGETVDDFSIRVLKDGLKILGIEL